MSAGKKKKAMGKGLGALLGVGDQGEYTEVHIDRVIPNPYQPRSELDRERLQELAESIKEHGIIQPLTVCRTDDDHRYQLVAGERRWRAARIAELNTVPVIIRDYSRMEMMELALIENLQREDLNPIEEATAFHTLLEEFHLTQQELSERIGKSRSSISNTLRLLNLPAEIQDLVVENSISEGHARALLSLDSVEDQLELSSRIVSDSLSVRQAEEIVRGRQIEPEIPEETAATSRRSADSADVSRETKNNVVSRETRAEVAGVEEELSELFKTEVKIKKGKSRGRIEIEFYDTEDLNRLLDIMLGRSYTD